MTYTILYYVRIVWETSKIERNDLNESTGDALNSLTLKRGSNNSNNNNTNNENNNKQKIRLIWAIRSFVVMSLVSHLALTFRCCLNCGRLFFYRFLYTLSESGSEWVYENELKNMRESSEYLRLYKNIILSTSLVILNHFYNIGNKL